MRTFLILCKLEKLLCTLTFFFNCISVSLVYVGPSGRAKGSFHWGIDLSLNVHVTNGKTIQLLSSKGGILLCLNVRLL